MVQVVMPMHSGLTFILVDARLGHLENRNELAVPDRLGVWANTRAASAVMIGMEMILIFCG